METRHLNLHEKALNTVREYLRCEAELIGILQEMDEQKTFLHFEKASLFAYATQCLGLSESMTYALIGIARKSMEVPELKRALEEKKMTLSNARRIAPILNADNKEEWIGKAATLSQKKLELELAKSFPQRAMPTRIISRSEIHGRLEVDLPTAILEKLQRVQEVLSQKKKRSVNASEALEEMTKEFLLRHDPLEKAKRAVREKKRLVAKPVLVEEESKGACHKTGRQPLQAKEKHEVTLRDQGQCSHRYPNGTRCESRQWLHIHHVKEIARGGTNETSNLRLLCSAHHRFVHTLSAETLRE